MTSEQQVKNRYEVCKVLIIESCFFIEVQVQEVKYIIGMGTTRKRAFTDAAHNLGMKRLLWSGNYQKHKLHKHG